MNIQDLREKGLIIFECITGSTAYGTATENSDVDIKGVFVQPLEDILTYGYIDTVSDEKNDTTFYELKRFVELLEINNPTVLEFICTPEDLIIQMHPSFLPFYENALTFLSKKCENSFAAYAAKQILKARGLNKKIVNPITHRKQVLDFCYVPFKQGSIPVKNYLKMMKLDQEKCGLVAVSNMRYFYAVFYDENNSYNGIVRDQEKSNDICLSSVQKNQTPLFYLQFNKDGWSTHCKEYAEYVQWEKKRNKTRFADNMLHGKGFDGKNMAHCLRLIDVATEIGEGKGIIIRRPNRDFLLSIRKGEIEYEDLLSIAHKKVENLKRIYQNSSLPDSVDTKITRQFLLEVRLKFEIAKKTSQDGKIQITYKQ